MRGKEDDEGDDDDEDVNDAFEWAFGEAYLTGWLK